MKDLQREIKRCVQNCNPGVGRNMEVIYISSDLSAEQHSDHCIEIGNWMYLPFNDQRNEIIKKKYSISAIP